MYCIVYKRRKKKINPWQYLMCLCVINCSAIIWTRWWWWREVGDFVSPNVLGLYHPVTNCSILWYRTISSVFPSRSVNLFSYQALRQVQTWGRHLPLFFSFSPAQQLLSMRGQWFSHTSFLLPVFSLQGLQRKAQWGEVSSPPVWCEWEKCLIPLIKGGILIITLHSSRHRHTSVYVHMHEHTHAHAHPLHLSHPPSMKKVFLLLLLLPLPRL